MPLMPCGLRWRAVCILALLIACAAPAALAGPASGAAPYPPSAAVPGISLDWSSYRQLAQGSDNWTTTWAADGSVYTSWGDGGGFGPGADTKAYVSFGIARLTGSNAASIAGSNLIGGLSPRLLPCFPPLGGMVDSRHARGKITPCAGKGLAGKSRSMLALGSNLYMFVTPGSTTSAYKEARLYKAPLGSSSWTAASWAFTRSPGLSLLAPNLVQGGQNASALAYVYAYAALYAPAPTGYALQKGPRGGLIYLLRAAKNADLMQRGAWQFYAGQTGTKPLWTSSQTLAQPVFIDRNGVSYEISAIYVPSLGRYLLMTEHGQPHAGQLGLFEAPTPQGPWSTVFYGSLTNRAQGVPATTFYASFLANSLSGNRFTLLFTGIGPLDALNAINGQFR